MGKPNTPDPAAGAPERRKPPRAYNTETAEEALARVRASPGFLDDLIERMRNSPVKIDDRGPLCGYLPEYDINRPAPAKKARRKRPPAGS
jgi:hypothetical protein